MAGCRSESVPQETRWLWAERPMAGWAVASADPFTPTASAFPDCSSHGSRPASETNRRGLASFSDDLHGSSPRFNAAWPTRNRPPALASPVGTFVWVVSAYTMCQTAARVRSSRLADRSEALVREVRDERELVRRCREGSEAAYAELVRNHRPRLYLLAYRLVGDRETAEDVVQETFLAAFRQIEKVEPRPSLNPWLNTIVLRTAGRAASRRRSRPGPSLDQVVRHQSGSETGPGVSLGDGMVDLDPSGDPHAAAEAAELRRDLAAALIDLPFNYRAAVVLRHVMGVDYAEAALEMGVPLNTFKSHLLRGTRLLREALADRLEPNTAAPAPMTPAVPLAGHAPDSGNGHRPTDLAVGSEQSLRR